MHSAHLVIREAYLSDVLRANFAWIVLGFWDLRASYPQITQIFLDWNTFLEIHRSLNSDATVEQTKIAKKIVLAH